MCDRQEYTLYTWSHCGNTRRSGTQPQNDIRHKRLLLSLDDPPNEGVRPDTFLGKESILVPSTAG